MVIKSAGGWGETENNLVLEGWLGDRIVCRKEVGESRYAAGITARLMIPSCTQTAIPMTPPVLR
ncbi:MAG: hypothetical protein ACLVAW_23045 [Eisenbergiella massiliensis]